MEAESYDLKASSGPAVPLLSLRASARLMGQLLGRNCTDATIEFLSASEARIAIGGVEYDMKFCDINATVSLIPVPSPLPGTLSYHHILSCKHFSGGCL
jgi:hypothetical protein